MKRALLLIPVLLAIASPLFAHCDSTEGPVVMAAREAFKAGDVTPVLKWVAPADEATVREAFARALKARLQGGAAVEVADTWFFETLVRLHRQSEGVPYTGLVSGAEVPHGIEAADEAIDAGSATELQEGLTKRIQGELQTKFERVREAKKHAGESVEAGRKFVAAYVDFIHYAENLYEISAPAAPQHGQAHAH